MTFGQMLVAEPIDDWHRVSCLVLFVIFIYPFVSSCWGGINHWNGIPFLEVTIFAWLLEFSNHCLGLFKGS